MSARVRKVLFVGGPMHGVLHPVPDNSWSYMASAPGRPFVADLVRFAQSEAEAGWDFGLPELIRYERVRWRYQVDDEYADPDADHDFVMLGPISEDRPAVRQQDGLHPVYPFMADRMWRARAEELIPECVVPGCAEKGRYTFGAAEPGRLAGRDWNLGDEIRVCPEHGHDIYLAQGVYGIEHLAEWLRPDAKLDPLDAYDAATDSLFSDQIIWSRSRMLRLAVNLHEQ